MLRSSKETLNTGIFEIDLESKRDASLYLLLANYLYPIRGLLDLLDCYN